MGKPQVPVQKKKSTYQSFPDQAGGSQSFNKLTQLRLPALDGLSFLDVGCNEGFFCGFALHRGARRVVGIDKNAEVLTRAKSRFPECEFLNQNWDVLPEGPFDVILLASALHYAEDQPALIKRLIDNLTPDGILVLELGIVSSPKNEWIPVKRSIDTRYYPTMARLNDVLAPYAFRFVGPSVNQGGDPVDRFVVHIRRRRPYAFLLMMPGSYGKTTIAKTLFRKSDIPLTTGDGLLWKISKGEVEVSGEFKAFMDKNYKKGEVARLTRELCEAGMIDDYIDAWAGQSAKSDVAFEGFIPQKNHGAICDGLRDRGYFPVTLNWELLGRPITSPSSSKVESERYQEYLNTDRSTLADPGSQHEVSPASGQKPVNATPHVAAKPDHQRGPYMTWKAEGHAGFVDNIKVEGRDVTVSGWSIDKSGKLPRQLVVDLMKQNFVFNDVPTVRRPDVQKVFGLDHDKVGFVVMLKLNAVAKDTEIGKQISVKPGGGEGIGKPFRVAPRLRSDA